MAARRRVAQQRQAVVQAGGKAFDPEHLDARCGELDRQRQAVEPPTNLDDQRGVRIGQREVFDDRGHALDEQLHGRESRRLRGGQPGRRLAGCRAVRDGARVRPAPRAAPGWSPGCRPRHSAENRRRQAGRRVDDMLAIVEQQQHPAVSKGSDQAGKRIFGADFQAEHGRNRARHQARVAERRQIDQPDAVLDNRRSCARRRRGATVVLPMPPGPTIVTRRWRESRETSAATTSSRPIIRVAANGRLCSAVDAIVGAQRGL